MPKRIRDATPAFTIFYMGINIGAFTATLLCGWLGETFGWRYGFGAAGVGMMFGLHHVLAGDRSSCTGIAEPANPERPARKNPAWPLRETAIYLGSVRRASARCGGCYNAARSCTRCSLSLSVILSCSGSSGSCK